MLKRIAMTGLAAVLGLAMSVPATAAYVAPAKPAIAVETAAPVIKVQGREFPDDYRRGFYIRDGYGWYNGYRGYRHRRHGYRHHHGYWIPPAAFALGAIIGSQAPRYRYRTLPGYRSPAHIAWCHDRYRSYREYDNSWQPYHGPRRQCRSPYY